MAARLLAKQAKLITRLTNWPQIVAESLNYDNPREVNEIIDRGLETLVNDWEDFLTNHRHLEDDPGIESTTYYVNDDYDVANLAHVRGAGRLEALRSRPAPKPDKRTCPLCKEDHTIYRCETFKGHTPMERREQVFRFQLCLNCLGNHRALSCKSTVACHTCAPRHHTLLHDCYCPNPTRKAPAPDCPQV
jgi:hypothetical protein